MCSSLPVENYVRYADSYAIELTDKNQTTYTLKENTRFLGSELFSYCYYMTSVNIPEGITAIGHNAFLDCNALTSITLPDGVKHIESRAFSNCDELTSVTLGSGILTIGNEAFSDCGKLQSLTLPDGVTQVGAWAFYNCYALSSINIPAGVTSIGQSTFQHCNSLKEVTLSDNISSIGNNAFYQCHALSSINIPSKIKTIGNHAFSDCNSLKSIILQEGLTSIGEYAFYSCDALSAINIPAGVNYILNSTFCDCNSLQTATLPEGLLTVGYEAFRNCHSLREINIPSTVTTIGNWAFYNCNQLLSIKLPEGLTQVGDYTFYNCSGLRNFEISSTVETIGVSNLDSDNITIVSHATTPPAIAGGCYNKLIYVPAGSGAAYRELYPDNIIIDGEGTTVTVNITTEGTLGEEVLKQTDYMYNVNNLVVSGKINNTDLENIRNSMSNLITIDFSGLDMETIPSSFLYNKRSLTKAILPSNAKELGQEAFRYCTRLKEVVLPEGLEKINYAAFFESGIENITIPESVKEIGNSAFDDCYNLKSINIPDGVSRIEDLTFSSCRSLNSIKLSDNLTHIGNYAFEGCSALTSMILPETVTTINSYAFANCPSLESAILPKALTHIGYEAFANCSSLKSIEIPNKVTNIESWAFRDCDKLETVKILGANTLGEYVFHSCDNLKEVTLPYTLTKSSNYIFNECYQLKSVTCEALFPPTVEVITPTDNCVLYAPEWTLDKYKLAAGWSGFKTIEPITNSYPAAISISDEQMLTIPTNGLPEDYKPNMTLVSEYMDYWNQHAGKLTVRGSRPLTLSTFEMQQTRDANSMTVLVNNGAMSADSVVTKLNFQAHRWHFLSFPYDVKISDIVADGDWVVRYYDGVLRAQGDYDNTWQNVPYDSILHAGIGYIWHSNSGYFEIPAMNNDKKNNIFSNATSYIQLNENVSSNAADNGWNLIGNPYPCYFDTRYIQLSSPITVRIDEYNYAAYSPIDDSYILSPLEAFFVQCSSENSLIGFTTEGRQTNNSVREASAPRRTRGVSSNRRVFNLYLENESYADHTRFVINEEAALDYEIAYDAAKFMSDDPAVHQLFTMENGERMAINERPMANGEVTLGVYVGKAGTYTFSLDTRVNDTEVVLVDKFTGATTDLMTSDYTFTAEAGTLTDRFVVCMKSDVLSGIANTTSAARVKIATTEGLISVSHANAPVQVYDAAGALVGTKSGDEVIFEVAPGIYMVKVGSEVHKISVVK